MSISKTIVIVKHRDGGRSVLVNGQNITGWISADSEMSIGLRGANSEDTLTLTLVAADIIMRDETPEDRMTTV